jgi:hypothetical protein
MEPLPTAPSPGCSHDTGNAIGCLKLMQVCAVADTIYILEDVSVPRSSGQMIATRLDIISSMATADA